MEKLRKLFAWLNRVAEEASGGPAERILREARARFEDPAPAEDEYQLAHPECPKTPLDIGLAITRFSH